MSGTFNFELVSPEKLLYSKPAVMVTVPGGEGEYGVMSNHVPMVTTIKAGVVRVYSEDDASVTDRIFVEGGFAEVTQSRFTVLAGEATPVCELNLAEIQQQIKDLDVKIAAAQIAANASEASESERAALQAQHEVLQAKLYAAA